MIIVLCKAKNLTQNLLIQEVIIQMQFLINESYYSNVQIVQYVKIMKYQQLLKYKSNLKIIVLKNQYKYFVYYKIYKQFQNIQNPYQKYLSKKKQKIYVFKINKFKKQACQKYIYVNIPDIAQILILPIQTMITNYAILQQQEKTKLIKILNSNDKKQFSTYLKDHAALRNIMCYYTQYIKYHQFNINTFKQVLKPVCLYSSFYQILSYLISLLINDYQTKLIKCSSLGIDDSVFNLIWKNFHKISQIQSWLQEIIFPIKQTVSLFQITKRYLPIIGDYLKFASIQNLSFQQYQQHLINRPIQNYMTTNVTRNSIQQYRNKSININNVLCPKLYNQQDVFVNIIYKSICNFNIEQAHSIEAICFLHFIAKHNRSFYSNNQQLVFHPSIKNKKIWISLLQIRDNLFNQLSCIGISLDILGFIFNIDTFEHSKKPFQAIQNDQQTQQLKQSVMFFIDLLQNNYPKKKRQYCTLLLEKSFKFKKYQVVKILLLKGINIQNYCQIFDPISDQNLKSKQSRLNIKQKSKIIQLMKNKDPQMLRTYLWQQILNFTLKKNKNKLNITQLNTINRGYIYVDLKLYDHLTSKNLMNNTLSRNDYMFSNNRLIANINIQQSNAYIELTQYPLLRYFYEYFLAQLEKTNLMLHFCGLFGQKNGHLFHLIQCIPNCFNVEKALYSHTEAELKQQTSQQSLSQAIIISLMLMPTNIFLKNIIFSRQTRQNKKKNHLIIDFHDFYQKKGFSFMNDSLVLKIKNSLFLFDEMKNNISQKLIQKYANIDPIHLVNSVFKKCTKLINEINVNRPKNIVIDENQRQLYSLIFQNNFAFTLTQRIFKIKQAFNKDNAKNLHINHLELMQIIDAPLSYYYYQIINSQTQLLARQKILLDDNFRKSFVIKKKISQFFIHPDQEIDNDELFPKHYLRFSFQGPSENLSKMHRHIDKFDIFSKKINDLKLYSHETIQYFLKYIDLSFYDKQERLQLFNKFQSYSKDYLNKQKNCSPLSLIRISYLQNLKQKHLKFSDQRLKSVIIQNINISQSQLTLILNKWSTVKNLTLKKIGQLQKVGQLFINIAGGLQIKNLQYLSITYCPVLAVIDISSCQQLKNATLRNNPSLTHIYIYSKKLQTLDCTNCTKLRIQNIGVYIFKDINVLLCNNSCDGDVLRFFNLNYNIFLTRIIKFLLNRFEQSNHYKLDLILTLNKLQLIDQKFYRFGNMRMSSSNMLASNLLNFITKAGRETLVITQQIIFQVFIKSSLISQLIVQELLEINLDSLLIIANYFKKQMVNKQFKQISLKLNKKQYIFEKQHHEILVTIFDKIKIQKSIKFHLKIINKQNTGLQIALIQLLARKTKLQKLQLIIYDSEINFKFLDQLFSFQICLSKILSLQFIQCKFINSQEQLQLGQNNIKKIQIKKCKFKNLEFFHTFNQLQNFTLQNCQIQDSLDSIYSIFLSFTQLKILKIINIKNNQNNQKQLYLSKLFSVLSQLHHLQHFDFSQNYMNSSQIIEFSKKISTIRIFQLKLNNFIDKKVNLNLQNFINNNNLRIIDISFFTSNILMIQSFMQMLSYNKSIIKVNINTNQLIQSNILQKINKNNKIQIFTSNQPLPNWLKNHIQSNAAKKTFIFQPQINERFNDGSIGRSQDFTRIGLSLDGGGIRGLLLATQLDYISRQVGQPLHKIFDCIGGTSIGGILALASTGSLDGCHSVCTTQDLKDIFQLYGTKIFKKSQFMNFSSVMNTKYDVKSFQDLLYHYFKQSKLSDTLPTTSSIVTAVNRITNQDMIFKSITSIFDKHKDFYLKDVARATSAAPTYFPSAQIKNIYATQTYSLIDGGMGLNNPSKLVIDQIIKTTQNQRNYRKNYFLLSLGTGRLKSQAIPQTAGIINLAPIIDSFTESANFFIQKDLNENYKGHYLRLSPFINLNRKDAELDNTQQSILNIYKETGRQSAEQYFSNNIAYGKFKNLSFIQWLRQNTARKYQS